MRKIPLTNDQVQQLRFDKQNGTSMGDLMYKYNLRKSAVYKYLNTIKEEPVPEANAREDHVDDHVDDQGDDEVEVEAEVEVEEADYLSQLFDGDEDNEGADEVVEQPSTNVTVKGVRKKVVIEQPPKLTGSIMDFLNKRSDKVEKVEKEKPKQPSKTGKKITPINQSDKIAKIMKIKNYVQTFNGKLSGIMDVGTIDKQRKYITSLSKMNDQQLDIQLEMIRQSIGTVTSHKAVKLGYMSMMEIVEKIGGRVVDIEGFRKDIEDNEEIDQVLKELACEYDIFSQYFDPKYRLVGLTGFQLMSTHKKNKIIKHQQTIINSLRVDKPLNQSFADKYNDI